MKALNLVIAVIASTTLNAQVKLQPKTFDNGYKYPHVVVSDQSISDSINKQLQANIADLKASDFCIGEYGYVQKGNHIEIHLLANCLEMQSGEHRYLFFNTETGEMVPHYDLFASKQKEDALKYIRKRIKEYKATDVGCTEEFKALPESASYDDFTIRLYKDGIEIRPLNSENCTKTTLRITWSDLKEYLKYNFI